MLALLGRQACRGLLPQSHVTLPSHTIKVGVSFLQCLVEEMPSSTQDNPTHNLGILCKAEGNWEIAEAWSLPGNVGGDNNFRQDPGWVDPCHLHPPGWQVCCLQRCCTSGWHQGWTYSGLNVTEHSGACALSGDSSKEDLNDWEGWGRWWWAVGPSDADCQEGCHGAGPWKGSCPFTGV